MIAKQDENTDIENKNVNEESETQNETLKDEQVEVDESSNNDNEVEENKENEESALGEDKEEEESESDKEVANKYLNQLQRLQAEFDNFRKREEKNRLAFKDVVTENVVVDLLPVVDNFERALEASKLENATLENLKEGMNLIYKQMETFLDKLYIKKMDSLGEEFNPAIHDAVSKLPSKDYEEDHIMQVVQNGWQLRDKVIRHAMVVVSSGDSENKKEDN